MGFYSASTIVEDAKRHGVEVRPIDVTQSVWDCTLEAVGEKFAVRMGLRYVVGLGEEQWKRILNAALEAPFSSAEDFAQRTGLDERRLRLLAECGALERLSTSRRDAIWQVRRVAYEGPTTGDLPLFARESEPEFRNLDEFETIEWDYRASAHSPRGHPLGPCASRSRAWASRAQSKCRRCAMDSACATRGSSSVGKGRGPQVGSPS